MTLFHELFPEKDRHKLVAYAVVDDDKWVRRLTWELERGNPLALAFKELELMVCQHFLQGALRDDVSSSLDAPFLEMGHLIGGLVVLPFLPVVSH